MGSEVEDSAATALPIKVPSASMFDDMLETAPTSGYKNTKVPYDKMDMFTQMFCSDNSEFAEQTIYLYFRKIFSKKLPEVTLPTATHKSTTDLATILVEYIKQDYNTVSKKTLMEAVTILTNFVCVSEEKWSAVLQAGGFETLVKLIRNAEPSSELKLQCIRVIGNIAADCDSCRSSCCSTDILELLGDTLDIYEFESVNGIRTLVSCLFNITRTGIPTLELKVSKRLVLALYRIIVTYKNNNDILSDAIWCLADVAHLNSFDREKRIKMRSIVDECGLIDTMVHMVLDDNCRHEPACLRVLCKTFDPESGDFSLPCHVDFCTMLKKALRSKRKIVRVEAVSICQSVSESRYRGKLLLDNDVYAFLLYEVCRSDSDVMMQRICQSVLYTLIKVLGNLAVSRLFRAGVCTAFPFLCSNQNQAVMAMRCLVDVLRQQPKYIGLVKKLQIVDKISTEALQTNPPLRPLKVIVENMIQGNTSNTKPFTFKLFPHSIVPPRPAKQVPIVRRLWVEEDDDDDDDDDEEWDASFFERLRQNRRDNADTDQEESDDDDSFMNEDNQ